MKTFGQEIKEQADFPNQKIQDLRYDLIKEELEELKVALQHQLERPEWISCKPKHNKFNPGNLSKPKADHEYRLHQWSQARGQRPIKHPKAC